MNNNFDTNTQLVPVESRDMQCAESTHVQSAQGLHAPGTHGLHAQGAQGLHAQGADGMPLQGADNVTWQDDYGYKRRLTLRQKRVLEWLAKVLRGEEKTISFIYRRIGAALGMSQRAARVHVDALKEKGLLLTAVAYRPGSGQRIGVRISITPDAPIKHLPHKLSQAEIQKMKDFARKEAQTWELIKSGHTLIPDLNGHTLIYKNPSR